MLQDAVEIGRDAYTARSARDHDAVAVPRQRIDSRRDGPAGSRRATGNAGRLVQVQDPGLVDGESVEIAGASVPRDDPVPPNVITLMSACTVSSTSDAVPSAIDSCEPDPPW
jgi:hypothetical protein